MMEPTMLIFLSVRFPIISALTFQVQGNDSNLVCQLWQSNFFFLITYYTLFLRLKKYQMWSILIKEVKSLTKITIDYVNLLGITYKNLNETIFTCK